MVVSIFVFRNNNYIIKYNKHVQDIPQLTQKRQRHEPGRTNKAKLGL